MSELPPERETTFEEEVAIAEKQREERAEVERRHDAIARKMQLGALVLTGVGALGTATWLVTTAPSQKVIEAYVRDAAQDILREDELIADPLFICEEAAPASSKPEFNDVVCLPPIKLPPAKRTKAVDEAQKLHDNVVPAFLAWGDRLIATWEQRKMPPAKLELLKRPFEMVRENEAAGHEVIGPRARETLGGGWTHMPHNSYFLYEPLYHPTDDEIAHLAPVQRTIRMPVALMNRKPGTGDLLTLYHEVGHVMIDNAQRAGALHLASTVPARHECDTCDNWVDLPNETFAVAMRLEASRALFPVKTRLTVAKMEDMTCDTQPCGYDYMFVEQYNPGKNDIVNRNFDPGFVHAVAMEHLRRGTEPYVTDPWSGAPKSFVSNPEFQAYLKKKRR